MTPATRLLTLSAVLTLLLATAAPPSAAAPVGGLNGRLNAAAIGSDPAGPCVRTFLTAIDRLDLDKMGIKPGSRAVRIFDSGLDIYEDTPDFDNFVQVVGKYLGKGTCLGMCEIIKNAHEQGRFDPAGALGTHELAQLVIGLPVTLHGYGDLRSLSAKEAGRLKAAMDAAHLDNLRPESWLPWLRDAVKTIPDRDTYRAFTSRIGFGRAAKISIQSDMPTEDRKIGPVKVTLPNYGEFSGHVLLVYKIVEFPDEAILFVYDPNVRYEKNHSNVATGFRYDRSAEKLSLHPAAFAGGYPWARHIFCVDGLTGPWAEQLAYAFQGLLKEVGKRIEDGVETVGGWIDRAREGVVEKAKEVGGGVSRAYEGAKKTVEGWFKKLF